jgi:CheY-like chemotaxis protein
LGTKVDEAINGKIAIEMIKKKTYDIVLMDIQMPEMDGLSATRILREEGFVNLPIIAMSAHTSKEEHQRSLSAGMNAHLNKPFRIRDLESIFIYYFPDKVVEVNNVSAIQQKCWADELPEISGLVLNDELCGYWLKKEDFLQKLETFIQYIGTESERLHALMDNKDFSTVQKLLHKLKGSVKLYGAKKLFESIEQLENLLSEERNTLLSQPLLEFDAAVAEITGS